MFNNSELDELILVVQRDLKERGNYSNIDKVQLLEKLEKERALLVKGKQYTDADYRA